MLNNKSENPPPSNGIKCHGIFLSLSSSFLHNIVFTYWKVYLIYCSFPFRIKMVFWEV